MRFQCIKGPLKDRPLKDRRRRAYFSLMEVPLSVDLRKYFKDPLMSIRKDDEVLIVGGKYKGRRGKVVEVFRATEEVCVEQIRGIKVDVKMRVHISKLVLTKLRLYDLRKMSLVRKGQGHAAADKDKAPEFAIHPEFTIEDIMPDVDLFIL